MSEAYDVIIIGYGPGGEVLASTLGAAGAKVLVVERWPQPYPLPRLTTLCGECCRVIQATGLGVEEAFGHTLVSHACEIVDADGEPVLTVPYEGLLGGWPCRVSMFQPDIDKAIADKVETMPNVELLRGWEATELWQEADQVHVIIAPFARQEGHGAAPRTVRAKYVVGADGARSAVRQMAAIDVVDSGLHERWLNFDAECLTPLPERFMALKIFMDPERPHMFMPIGKRGLRMEFRVMDGETDEWATDPAVTDEFMLRKYGLTPDDVRIMRRVVYHYRTRLAAKWRLGRIFLAGDAAHTMPPYMGQGAAAAIRDGRNLGWKLVEVLAGRSHDSLLDDYQAEREPHVRTIQHAASVLSDVINVTDPAAAAARNAGMREQGVAKPPQLPSLAAGALHRGADGSVAAPAGLFGPQGKLRRNGVEALGDTLLGDGFQLWSRRDPDGLLAPAERAWLDGLGCTIAVFEQPESAHYVEDLDGVYRAFLARHDVDFLLLRPDFHVFGAVKDDAAGGLVRELAERLHSTSSLKGGN